jgi:hypothetical protein
MPDIPDIQWCLPSRRQHTGVPLFAAAKAIGATKLQAITASTRLATKRRILMCDGSTSQPTVTTRNNNRLVLLRKLAAQPKRLAPSGSCAK